MIPKTILMIFFIKTDFIILSGNSKIKYNSNYAKRRRNEHNRWFTRYFFHAHSIYELDSRVQITFIYLTSPSFAEQKKKKNLNEKTQTKITPPCPFWLPPSVYFIFLLLHLT